MNDKKYVVYFFFFKIIWKTPIKIKITPLAILTVICSWKNIIPKKIAVNGSKAPSIAVVVEPINFIEIVIVSSDIIVGNNAKPIANTHIDGVDKVCSGVVVNIL